MAKGSVARHSRAKRSGVSYPVGRGQARQERAGTGMDGVPVGGLLCDLDAVMGENGEDLTGHRFRHALPAVCPVQGWRLILTPDEGGDENEPRDDEGAGQFGVTARKYKGRWMRAVQNL
jgi:hypothetical protein